MDVQGGKKDHRDIGWDWVGGFGGNTFPVKNEVSGEDKGAWLAQDELVVLFIWTKANGF